MTLVLTRKRLCFGGIDLQKLEVIFGSIGIYTNQRHLHFNPPYFTSFGSTSLPTKKINISKKKHLPTCISASTGASFLPPLAALRGAKGVNAAGFGVSGAGRAARSGEAVRGVATGGAGVPGMGVWGAGVAGIKRPGVDGAVPIGTGDGEVWGQNFFENSFETITLVFQNPPVIPCEDGYLDPLKAEPQEMFMASNTYSQGIWKTRVRKVDLVGHDAWKKKFQKDSPQMVGFWMGMNPRVKSVKHHLKKQIYGTLTKICGFKVSAINTLYPTKV